MQVQCKACPRFTCAIILCAQLSTTNLDAQPDMWKVEDDAVILVLLVELSTVLAHLFGEFEAPDEVTRVDAKTHGCSRTPYLRMGKANTMVTSPPQLGIANALLSDPKNAN